MRNQFSAESPSSARLTWIRSDEGSGIVPPDSLERFEALIGREPAKESPGNA